jgi:two-component system, response regulator YesN
MKDMKILLIEDEPSAMRHLKSIIELRCKGFLIVGTAENGAEGLEKVRSLNPDVVITDIKMPVMDGIKLVAHIKQEFPSIYSIIVSGYQDFEYAKGALQCGVVDYLLKPVNASQLNILLENIHQKLERHYYLKRIELMKQILLCKNIEISVIEKYLPFKSYSLAIVRQNGLPSRFNVNQEVEYNNPILEIWMEYNIKNLNNIWILQGRDEKEVIFVFSPDITSIKDFKTYFNGVISKLDNGYHTAVLGTESFKISDFKRLVSILYRTLDNNIVIGLSQTILGLSVTQAVAIGQVILDEMLSTRIGYLVSNVMFKELKLEFIKLLDLWEKEHRTQLWLESNLRQILHIIRKHSNLGLESQNYDLEFLLDEALCCSTTFGELMANTWELVGKIVQQDELKNMKVDTPDFFNSIGRYLEQNISEPLSIPIICGIFGISQTYMSRLFRKYKNMSFNEYLTVLRVEKAKQIILENPSMNLKDVATFVGFNDQFYFSRVFRSVTGSPPSEFFSVL